ncbi:MAG TPA: phage portal protein, partial [Bacillota bacterium]|nr:phage portal protein [Bacillota bacterium]
MGSAFPSPARKEGKRLSIFDRLFGRRDKVMVTRLMDLYIRGFTNPLAGRALYSIPEIRTAINFIAEKTASVPFRHVRLADGGVMLPLEDNIQRVLAVRPNPYNTPQAFINVVVTRLLVNGYAYIYPEWEGKALRGLYPLPFASHTLEKDAAGQQWVTFDADTGKLPFLLEDLIILNRFPALGEGKKLTTYTDPVSNYVNILGTIQGQAVADAETAGRIAGLLKTQVPLNEADLTKKLESFKNAYMTSQNVTGLG